MNPVETHMEYTFYRRFSVLHRFFHLVVLISFTFLALSGLPLKYSGCTLSQWLIALLGGVGGAATIHRCMGIVTFGYVVLHLVWLSYYKVVLKGRLWGAGSMVPQLKDFQDLWQNLKYFLGKGAPPQLERFAYWEKFDYLAVFWGVPVIGLSGLVLWFPEFFSRYLPGEFLNVAYILHSDEALLAVGFIFVVHMFNVHLRPEVFPLTKTIFNGKITEEELKRDHFLEWQRITGAAGTLPAKVSVGGADPKPASAQTQEPMVEAASVSSGAQSSGDSSAENN